MTNQRFLNGLELVRSDNEYSDLDLDFLAHPTTGDIVKKRGEAAIKRALRNILLLAPGEIGFQPDKGSGIYHMLFQPFTPATISFLQKEIEETISAYEPRVAVENVEVQADLDNNGININILFYIVNYNEPSTLEIFLTRVR